MAPRDRQGNAAALCRLRDVDQAGGETDGTQVVADEGNGPELCQDGERV